MVSLNVNRHGTKQWIFQRIANLLIVLLSLCFVVVFATFPVDDYASLIDLLNAHWVKVIASISLIVLSLNSMLAGWQIAGDYVKGSFVNYLFNTLCIVVSVMIAALGNYIIWF
ncbi:succinate dehydrogenase, hydrophobic membrane anchor protein [Pseudoalteromonas spongiae]|uniref:succinate dehydrogenase, hydrophobic membrane anchor protein n=1 Tax=Pseudoalteromonas spongiae TaxID=298657 RepID=UPI0012FD8750|nr:succinate dehydrogenase, hydrophobic membrane anchor protein [Pseudoalteromonas spongiae]